MKQNSSEQTLQKASLYERIVNYFAQKMSAFTSFQYQYESRKKIFNIPLLSINLGFDKPDRRMHHVAACVCKSCSFIFAG